MSTDLSARRIDDIQFEQVFSDAISLFCLDRDGECTLELSLLAEGDAAAESMVETFSGLDPAGYSLGKVRATCFLTGRMPPPEVVWITSDTEGTRRPFGSLTLQLGRSRVVLNFSNVDRLRDVAERLGVDMAIRAPRAA